MSTEEPRRGPVEELFARERTAIQNLPADDVHWQRLVGSARARRRSRHLRYAGAAAAAVLLASGVAWLGLGSHPVAAPPATRTATPGPVTSSAPAPSPTKPPATTTSWPGLVGFGAPVPRDFTAMSMSNAGRGAVFVMGAGDCGGTRGRCPVLLGSTDDGRTWSTVHAFPDAVAPSSNNQVAPVQPGSVLSQTRFASPEVGWVFGGGAFETRDGGRTWHAYGHPGDALVALETDGQHVYAVAGQTCAPTRCSGKLALLGGPVAQNADAYLGARPLGDDWADPAVALVGGQPVVAVRTTHGGVVLRPGPGLTLSTGAPLPGCNGAQPQVATADASTQPALTGLCTTQGAAGSLGYAVLTSTDGARWEVTSTDGLLLVNAGHVSLAAADPRDLLAVSGGTPDLHGAMKVSHDGGRTWSTPAGAPPLPDTGWRWVGAPGGSTYYALAGDGAAYWVSDDLGEHWHQVRLVR